MIDPAPDEHTMDTMHSSPITLQLVYTQFGSPDLGQDQAGVVCDGPPLILEARSGTRIGVDHPPGQTLRLREKTLASEFSSHGLEIILPPSEDQFDLTILVEPSGATAKVKVTTKKEFSKPEEVRRMSLKL